MGPGAAPAAGWYSASGTARAGLADGEGSAAGRDTAGDDTAGDEGAAVRWAPTADAAGGTTAS